MDRQHKRELTSEYKRRKVVGGVYAIKNEVSGKRLIEATQDMAGSRNKFAFFHSTGAVISRRLQRDAEAYGSGSFSFEVLEELEKPEEQTPKAFREDLEVLLALWLERFEPETLL